MLLGNALGALADKMEPQPAAEIAKRGVQRLAAALENPQETDPNRLSDLGNALGALANKIEPQAAAELAKGLAAALENPREFNPTRLSCLGDALGALANKMEPQAAAELAKGLAAALENPQETNSDWLWLNSNKGTKSDMEGSPKPRFAPLIHAGDEAD